MKPRVLILHAPGTNRDHDAALACACAGGDPEIVSLQALLDRPRTLADSRFLILPGGFSYGDDLGAGRLLGLALRHQLREPLARFIEAGRPVLGICNGFQALVHAGLLDPTPARRLSLAPNASGRFECRWVRLDPEPATRAVLVRGLEAPLLCPVAHGQGRVVLEDTAALEALEQAGQVALRYHVPAGSKNVYPHNPNGSAANIAAVCDPSGLVMGLMPHPEDAITTAQLPGARRREPGSLGLALFDRAVAWTRQLD